MAPVAQRVMLMFNALLVAVLLMEHQAVLPNTKAAIEKQINRLMEQSAETTVHTIEKMQNDLHILMEDATRKMGSNANTNALKEKKIPQSSTVKCPHSISPIPADAYQSQNHEDHQLTRWFGNLCNGTYLELGALDGKRFSNSYVFHQYRHWKGLLIEGNPNHYARLVVNRPHELATAQAGVCDKAQDLHWVTGIHPDLGGFLEFASPHQQDAWFRGGGMANASLMPCQPLSTIIQTKVGTPFYFDFASFNLEGAEYAALKSLDFDQVQFGMILVGADDGNERKNLAVKSLLEQNGYIYLMRKLNCYWMYHPSWHEIYASVIY